MAQARRGRDAASIGSIPQVCPIKIAFSDFSTIRIFTPWYINSYNLSHHELLVMGMLGRTILLLRMATTQVPLSRFQICNGRPGTGLGLFARTQIHKGDFILEYTGVRMASKIADEHPGRYLFEIDNEWTIYGEMRSNTARYINHDCHPNTEAEIDEDDRIMIRALRDIAAGEELTIDYGDEYFDEFIRPSGCKCASCAKGLKSPHNNKREG